MKKTIILSLLAILIIPLLVMGCGKTNAASDSSNKEAKTIEISIDEFTADNHITRNIELPHPGSLIVTLASNPTTGYQWGEIPVMTTAGKDPVMSQQSHNFVAPEKNEVVGAPGKDVWVFDSLRTGSTAINFGYGRSWEGGEKDTWTLAINVSVK